MLLLAFKYADDISEAIIVNANVGGDSCHRGALLGAVLGAAGCELSADLRDGLYGRETTAVLTEKYLGVVKSKGGTGELASSLPPRPGAAVESVASSCSS